MWDMNLSLQCIENDNGVQVCGAIFNGIIEQEGGGEEPWDFDCIQGIDEHILPSSFKF